MGHFHKLLFEEMIFFPTAVKIIISSHKSLWKCHSHNKGFLMQKYPFIPARDFSFILCKYLHFICFVENLWTSLRKIYGHGVSLENLCINLRTNKWKFRAGMNGYFCIKKILHFNGNAHFVRRRITHSRKSTHHLKKCNKSFCKHKS